MMAGAQVIPETADLSDTIKKAYDVNGGAKDKHRRTLLMNVSCYNNPRLDSFVCAFQ